MTPDLNLDEFSHGRCTACVGVDRRGRCNQGAITPDGLCRFHAKVADGLTDSSLFPATTKKVNGIYSYWTVAR